MLNRFRLVLTAVCAIIIVFIVLSFLTLIFTLLLPHFYSVIAFIATFAVGGIIASAFSFQYSMELSKHSIEGEKMTLIILQIIVGLASFFVLSKLQHSEFEIPFKSFGIALALGSLLHVEWKK